MVKFLLSIILSSIGGGSPAPTVVSTGHIDTTRQSWNNNERLLTPAIVQGGNFKKKASLTVSGYIFSQPLVVPGIVVSGQQRDLLIITTMNGNVYAFDANNYGSALINGVAAPGYSSGQAVAAMQRAAATVLPRDFAYEWTGVTLQELKAGSMASLIFALAIVFVFLILAAQIGADCCSAVEPVVAHGNPSIEILALAAERCTNLIVLGATRRPAFENLTRDRTVHRVLAHARCPVLTLREQQAMPEETHAVAATAVSEMVSPQSSQPSRRDPKERRP